MKYLLNIVTVIGMLLILSTAQADMNKSNSPSNFIQFNLSAKTTLHQPGYFYCTVAVTKDPTVLSKNRIFVDHQHVYLVNYAAMIDGFVPKGDYAGTLQLTAAQINHYAFAYYYDSRLPNEQAFVQLFVERVHYHIHCYPGKGNRPVYGRGIYG